MKKFSEVLDLYLTARERSKSIDCIDDIDMELLSDFLDMFIERRYSPQYTPEEMERYAERLWDSTEPLPNTIGAALAVLDAAARRDPNAEITGRASGPG